MNPTKYVNPALYAALTAPGLVYGGAAVPVQRHLADNAAGPYVLLDQPTATQGPGSRGCHRWDCTQLIQVITAFAPEAVSSDPANEIADLVLRRLQDQSLALPDGWQCGPGVAADNREVADTDGDLRGVRVLLRLRWPVYYHEPVAVAL